MNNKLEENNKTLEDWILPLLVNPITKEPVIYEEFGKCNGVLDARVFLKNSYGWSE